MAIIIGKRTNLDAPIKVESLNGVTFTSESEAHQFVVRCEQKGQDLTLAGTISAKFIRADGNTIQLVGSIADGAAVVTLAQDCYNVQGRFQLAIFNTVGDTKLCIYACVGTVQKAQSGNLIDGGSIIPDVEDLIADIQTAVQSIPPDYTTLLASIAGTYSASNTYAVGDYVWYNGSLYRCTTAITTAEAWTAGHWTAAVLGNDVADLKNALLNDVDDLEVASAEIEVVKNATVDLVIVGDALTYSNDTQGSWRYINGKWDFTTGGMYIYYHVVDYSVEQGKMYRVTGSENANHPIATFWDSNNNMIATSGDYRSTQTRKDAVTLDLAIPEGATIMRVSRFGTSTFPVVYELSASNNLADEVENFGEIMGTVVQNDEAHYPFASGDAMFNRHTRVFWNEAVPAGSCLTSVSVYIGNLGANPMLLIDVWEVDGDTLTKVKSIKKVELEANKENVVEIAYYSEKPLMISYVSSNANARYYRANQSGYSWKYTDDVSEDTTELSLSGLSGIANMKLIGGFAYATKRTDEVEINADFFSGYLTGNLVVFGDSTVDGSSTTGHTGNVIGTDRTASAEPNAFTSILEGMIQTFTGKSTRVFNGGFGGKTLNYIADNYAGIMAAFSDVKSALLVINVNSANGTRAEYENGIRTGLERMIALLQADGIAVAVASPQPMFFYPADNGGLPAINSAGEFAIAVNIGKDICTKYNLPFIDLGEITNRVMESPYFTSDTFYGDRIHFGDGGHKFEGYELYGKLIHPIIFYDGGNKIIRLESNQCELSAVSGIQANTISGYRSIVLSADHTRDDVISRFYIISLIPFKLGGVVISGWTYNADMYVDNVLYTEGTPAKGAVIQPGTHEVTIRPEAGKLVRFSGLTIESGE